MHFQTGYCLLARELAQRSRVTQFSPFATGINLGAAKSKSHLITTLWRES